METGFGIERQVACSSPRGSQLLPRVYEILVILASKYMGLMGDSRASVRDSALILASVADPSFVTEVEQ